MGDMLNSTERDETRSMTFSESIRVCLRKYAEFEGRASRSEFWWFVLFCLLIASALLYVSEAASSISLIAALMPILAAGARRLRDTGKSAGWLWFLLVPVGGIITLGILWAQPTMPPDSGDRQGVSNPSA